VWYMRTAYTAYNYQSSPHPKKGETFVCRLGRVTAWRPDMRSLGPVLVVIKYKVVQI